MSYTNDQANWPGNLPVDQWTAENLLRFLDVYGLDILVKPPRNPLVNFILRGRVDWRRTAAFRAGRGAYETRVALNRLHLVDPAAADEVAAKIISARVADGFSYGLQMQGFVGGRGIDAQRVIRERLDYLRRNG